MSTPSGYDATQDDDITVNKKVLVDLIAQVEALGGGDVTPTEWKEMAEPVPFTDRAVYPPYVLAGHLVAYIDGQWQCICHNVPKAPFNPHWGIEGHPEEGVGIAKYVPADHDQFILTFGETTQAERLARIQEVING